MQPPKNAFLSAKGLWRTELLVNIKCIKILKEIIATMAKVMKVTTVPLLLLSFLSPSVVPGTDNITVLCQSHKF